MSARADRDHIRPHDLRDAESNLKEGALARAGRTSAVEDLMPVRLNHTIVWCRDPARSAAFLAEILGRPAPVPFGPFLVVELDNGVSLDFHATEGEVARQHYAFLVGEEDFDAGFRRVRDRKLDYWADPGKKRPGEINRNDGGRGVYFQDPDGHFLELITRPYGSGA
jgi:catechol 2,3-dioxygenase-like lactoylglutathione lyase family enzyme